MSHPRTIALVRHGRSAYNLASRLNGDPDVPVHLDETGRDQVAALRERVAELPVDLAVHTRFVRTRETLDILLADRDLPRLECPGLDDVVLGEFEGADIEAYRRFRDEHGQDARPRGGESRIDALRRYAAAFARLAQVEADMPLVVTHDIPIRFLSNAIRGEDPLDGPVTSIGNASLLLVSRAELGAAIDVMDAAVRDRGTVR